MSDQSNDREGRKPYRRYKAGRSRRSALDDELIGARPSRAREDAASGARRPSPQGSDKGYRTYGAQSGVKGRRGGRPNGTGKRRRFRWRYVPIVILLVLVVAAVVATVIAWPGYKKFDRAVDKSNKRIDRKTRAQLTADDGWILRKGTTVLLLGVDEVDEPARSDTIMLMHFDPSTHTINQLSIPRDTKVDIPGYGTNKINSAMFYGWPSAALAIKTIEDFTGIPINHVMIVDFQGFPRLVNAIGGVDMYVPKTVTTVAGSNARTVVFKKGMHHFDGKYAMLYVRIRYVDDDFHRARRQQQFLQALQSKIAQPSNILKLPEIGKRFMSGVATDLTTNQILELAYLKWRSHGGKKLVMKGTPGYENGVAYVFPPSEAARERMVAKFLNQ